MRSSSLLIGVYLCLSVAVLPGCIGGPKNFENENDRLRRENLDLRRQVTRLEESLQLRESELTAQRQRASDGVQPVEGATPPQLAAIRLDRYTAAVDTDGDGADDTVRAYVRPVDGRGRLLVVAARATVQVVAVREGQPPRTIAERSFSPDEWDAAYRSGFAGTHYTLELPLPTPLPDGAIGPATIHVTVTDAATGTQHTEQRATTVEPAGGAGR